MRLGKYLSSLTKPELEELKNICNFTDEELKILDCLVKEKSYEEISSYIRCSIATVGRKISVIKEKKEYEDIRSCIGEEKNACIKVSNRAYVGTKLMFGDICMFLKEKYDYCQFRKEGAEIKSLPL